MDGFREIFQGIGDSRKSNATKHDLIGMWAVALLSSFRDGRTCVGMADFAAVNADFLCRFSRP